MLGSGATCSMYVAHHEKCCAFQMRRSARSGYGNVASGESSASSREFVADRFIVERRAGSTTGKGRMKARSLATE